MFRALDCSPTAPAAAISSATATATARAGPVLSRARFVDRESATIELFAMQRLDRGVSAFLGFHGDESETAGPAAEPIHNQIHFQDGAVLGEHVLELVFGGVEREISDKQFSAHEGDFLTNSPFSTVPDRRVSNHQ